MEEGLSTSAPNVQASSSQASHPPFPKDEQIVRMLIVMNDALYTIDADPRVEYHRNAQNLFYSCKEWFVLHQIGIKKDVQANMYLLDASGYASSLTPRAQVEDQQQGGSGSHD
jgi:hypothetical protein